MILYRKLMRKSKTMVMRRNLRRKLQHGSPVQRYALYVIPCLALDKQVFFRKWMLTVRMRLMTKNP